jgi:hypothetical protein
VISGIPTTTGGPYNFSVTATNALGTSPAVVFSILIGPAASGGVTAVPALSEWGFILLGMLLAGLGLRYRKRGMH